MKRHNAANTCVNRWFRSEDFGSGHDAFVAVGGLQQQRYSVNHTADSRRQPIFLLARGDNPERTVGKRLLKREGLLRGKRQPLLHGLA